MYICFQMTERCIQQTGKTLQNVISEWILKLNNREIGKSWKTLDNKLCLIVVYMCVVHDSDLTRMPLNHGEAITSATYLCSDCYEKLVCFLLYWFRVTSPRHVSLSFQFTYLCINRILIILLLPQHLPGDARDDCWYGYSCRTQHRSEDHARKRNHVCRPTRGIRVWFWG